MALNDARDTALRGAMASAYSVTGGRWQHGPGLVYDRLATELVGRSPVSLHDATVLDVGAGTGAATRAAMRAGAGRAVVAVDAAWGMLASDWERRPPAVVGDAVGLPIRSSSVDAAVAAFSLNHLTDPVAGFVEIARVVRPGGAVIASTYADDDTHPVKAAVEAVLGEHGWTGEPWHTQMRERAAPQLATVEGCRRAATAAGLDARIDHVRVPFPELGARQLVAWRFGMAQHAPFIDALDPDEVAAVEREVLARLGDHLIPLVRSILVVAAVVR